MEGKKGKKEERRKKHSGEGLEHSTSLKCCQRSSTSSNSEVAGCCCAYVEAAEVAEAEEELGRMMQTCNGKPCLASCEGGKKSFKDKEF